jgi:glutathione S-transferase
MKLYVDRSGTAPSPRRVRIFLSEKSIEIPLEKLEIHKDNRTPAFREKNPLSTLPVLELDDRHCISESIAICRYLEELHPLPSLFGDTPLARADIETWLRRIELRLYIPIEFASEQVLPGEAAQLFRSTAHASMKLLDQTLADREFIAGSSYSIADAFALSALDFGIAYNDFTIPVRREHLRRWHAAVSSRPSARA